MFGRGPPRFLRSLSPGLRLRRRPSPFVEGVAEMFNDGVDLDEVRAPIAEVLDDVQITDVHYFTMGLFVRFLVERHDLDSLAAFMRDTDYEATRADYEPTFAKHFGESLDDAMLAFEGYPTCPEWSNRIAVVECGLPLMEWVDGALDMSVDMQCGSDDVTGPLEDEPMQIAAFAAFEVAVEGMYSLQVTSEIDGFSGRSPQQVRQQPVPERSGLELPPANSRKAGGGKRSRRREAHSACQHRSSGRRAQQRAKQWWGARQFCRGRSSIGEPC